MERIIGQPAGYKRIYGDYIPKGWKLACLSELAAVEYGISSPIDKTLQKGIRILSLPNVDKNGDFVLDEIPFIEKGKVSEDDYLKHGDLLFNWRNGSKEHLGKTAFFNLNGLYTHVGFLLRIRTKKNSLDPFFLKSYINFLRNNGFFLGAKIQVNNTFNKQELNELPVIFPKISEQQKIATILSTWDKAIELTQSLIKAKEQQKKGLMQRLMTGKVRLLGFREEWTEVTLREIVERVTRRNEKLDDTVVTISAQRGFVKQEEFFNKRVASKTLSNYYLIKRGEFGYNKSYSNGYPMGAFKRLDEHEYGVVTTLYICFRVRELKANSDFLLNYFGAGLMVQGLTRIAHEGGRAHGLLNIGISDFFNLKLVIPNVEEQAAIATILNEADKEIELLQQKLASLKTQKKGLMQQLMTGRIRVVKTKEGYANN